MVQFHTCPTQPETVTILDSSYIPLADRMRPTSIDEVVGQRHVLADGKPLNVAIRGSNLHSMVFWGPPGTGKTTLARLMARHGNSEFVSLSAVLSGVKDIREAVQSARMRKQAGNGETILFVDEVHRFNRSQQDAFLPHIENGTILFIGATTENPSFELNNALLSRLRVYVLRPLTDDELEQLIRTALSSPGRGLGKLGIGMTDQAVRNLAALSDGDARRALNVLEIASDLAGKGGITDETIQEILNSGAARRFDKRGDAFHEQISALHKSVRGSDPDAALYWFCRMLDGGCDPLYIVRRMVRAASEDIGNADPRALNLALDAWQVQERLGSPEGHLAIAQAIVYLAVAAKSNAVYTAFGEAMKTVRESGSLEVPLHLRNAPTGLMKALDYGSEYRYAHDDPGGYAAGENYIPDGFAPIRFYHPVDRGLEIRIREKLESLRQLDDRQPEN